MPCYDVLLRGGLHDNEPGDYLIAGPRWQSETPPGIKKVFRTTDFFVAACRTQLFNPGDMDNVIKARSDTKTENHFPHHFLPYPLVEQSSMRRDRPSLEVDNVPEKSIISTLCPTETPRLAAGDFIMWLSAHMTGISR